MQQFAHWVGHEPTLRRVAGCHEAGVVREDHGLDAITDLAAIALAGPLGYFGRTRRQGLGLYLIAWAVIFPIQTAVVHSENPDDVVALYFVFNAVILAGGIVLNTLGAWLRRRRARTAAT